MDVKLFLFNLILFSSIIYSIFRLILSIYTLDFYRQTTQRFDDMRRKSLILTLIFFKFLNSRFAKIPDLMVKNEGHFRIQQKNVHHNQLSKTIKHGTTKILQACVISRKKEERKRRRHVNVYQDVTSKNLVTHPKYEYVYPIFYM